MSLSVWTQRQHIPQHISTYLMFLEYSLCWSCFGGCPLRKTHSFHDRRRRALRDLHSDRVPFHHLPRLYRCWLCFNHGAFGTLKMLKETVLLWNQLLSLETPQLAFFVNCKKNIFYSAASFCMCLLFQLPELVSFSVGSKPSKPTIFWAAMVQYVCMVMIQ